MTPYQPTNRRPIADIFRATARLAVQFCVRYHLHPDAISYASIVAAALCGACFFFAFRQPILLLVAPLFALLRLWFNMLDGMVAIASGKASLRGEILNDLPDRVSDVLIFAAVAHSGFNSVLLGYWSAIFALLTAYVGMFGQAVGVRREFSGVMSKPWRMIVISLGAWMTFALLHGDGARIRFARLTVLDWCCAIIIIGCIQTIWVRLAKILRALSSRGS
jgi:phosphatidylglycerophosphate synthase